MVCWEKVGDELAGKTEEGGDALLEREIGTESRGMNSKTVALIEKPVA